MADKENGKSNYLEVVESLAFLGNVKELREQVSYLIECGHVSKDESGCDCGRSIEEHLKDLLKNFEFAKYFMIFARTLAEYPENASAWSKAICYETREADWEAREDEKDLSIDYPFIELEGSQPTD